MKTILRFIILAFTLGCGCSAADASALKIVAAENFYGGVIKQIVGDQAEVTSILTNPNQDPHEFTTGADTAKAVADADLIVYNGISYDPWMETLLGTKGRPDRVVIKVSDLIGAQDGDNPHIWYSPKTMPALVDKLLAILVVRDASNAALYQKNVTEFKKSMQPELDKIAALRKVCQGIKVTATEPVFGYMTEALGFEMLNQDFQVKIMNDTEPGADETAAFEKSLTSQTAKLLFYNSQVTDPTTERIQKLAKQSGLPVIGVTETQPPDQKRYAEWMLSELNSVQAALLVKN